LGKDHKARMSREFIQFPYGLVMEMKLTQIELRVLLELCHVNFRKRINPVPLSNHNLSKIGIHRHRKMAALKTLEAKGLVMVWTRNNRCPQVRLMWSADPTRSGWESSST
jgi:hypothetical protein